MASVLSSNTLLRAVDRPLKVAVLGSGNWGTTIAKVVAQNSASCSVFAKTVHMYVHPEVVDGRQLTDIINEKNENVKYLPGISLPQNLVASSDIEDVVSQSDLIVFVSPHQFMPALLDRIKPIVKPDARAISLVKGFHLDDGTLKIMTQLVHERLNIECAALSGANVASQVAEEHFSEATIASRNVEDGLLFQKLFHRDYFSIRCIRDVCGLQISGALKNAVAIACGLVDGLGLGSNSKAAMIRIGLQEMRCFAHALYHDIEAETFFESCGIADLITTCYAGRNRKCAESFAKTGKTWEVIEEELLNGQKLQGTLTAKEAFEVLQKRGITERFPLLLQTYRICYEGAEPGSIVSVFMSDHPPC